MNAQATLLSEITAQRPFRIGRAYGEFWPDILQAGDLQPALDEIGSILGAERVAAVEKAVLRSAFLIELVELPGAETTLFQTRWFEGLSGDPRRASFDECLLIAIDLLTSLPAWLAQPGRQELVQSVLGCSILPYEAPIDYVERLGKNTASERIHKCGNLAWTFTDGMLAAAELRAFLTDPERSPDSEFFAHVIKKKIAVKAYLTDRALTGDYKTNREKRWETHPASGQFASRRDCMEIEWVLITQICRFAGFPEDSLTRMHDTGALPDELVDFRCPVTLDVIDFVSFQSELSNRTHGRSNYQVGHLNPLKLGDPAGDAIGHTPNNISWISADGNRIQGSLSVAETRAMLRRIAHNYEESGEI